MSRLFITFLILLFTSTVVNAREVRIINDRGGVVTRYVAVFKRLAKTDTQVIIDGFCASSCTLALALPKVCVTPRAKLGFHQAYRYSWYGQRVTDYPLSRYLMSQYPPQIREWINRHGGLTPNIKILKGKEMLELLPNCP